MVKLSDAIVEYLRSTNLDTKKLAEYMRKVQNGQEPKQPEKQVAKSENR
jgi:hypothetical protein